MLEGITALLTTPADVATSPLDAERLEFQASLQLLAGRACGVSDALAGAIALNLNGVMSYCAVSGVSDREPGTEIAPDTEPFHECLIARHPVRVGPVGEPSAFTIAVPVLRDGVAAGFIELTGDREFSEETAQALSRIADLVAITLDHREAAERADKLEFTDERLDPPLPELWHAPEIPAGPQLAKATIASEISKAPATAPTLEVRTCAACGFPVSPGRVLCVECEHKRESIHEPESLFTTEAEESWLSAHGYTIASLVVTALTAALIVWLRH
jgi:hypothetical protein